MDVREIKFEYMFLDISEDGTTIIKQIWTLDELEKNVVEYNKLHLLSRRQYTGLKDSKGVEIYEGDIIKADGKTFSVVYHRSNFSIKAIHREKIVALLSVAQHNGCEVIGNIYENPELLHG